jgi:hypothetical protein
VSRVEHITSTVHGARFIQTTPAAISIVLITTVCPAVSGNACLHHGDPMVKASISITHFPYTHPISVYQEYMTFYLLHDYRTSVSHIIS